MEAPILLLEGPAAGSPLSAQSSEPLSHRGLLSQTHTLLVDGHGPQTCPLSGVIETAGDRWTCLRVLGGHPAVDPSHPGLKQSPGLVGSSGCLKSSPSVNYKPRHVYRVCLFSISF